VAEKGDRAADLVISCLLCETELIEERPPLIAGELAGVFGLCWDDGCAGHGYSLA
jgi:hypothetical protein